MEVLLGLSIALAAGLALSRVTKKFNLPSVTGYLVAGILVGPFCLGLLNIPGVGFHSIEAVKGFGVLSQAALGFIAFSIGSEFRLEQLKKTGKQATVIAIFQAVTATLMVDAVLIGLHFILGDKLPLPVAITLGAIGAATAPAATLMVVRQYKAKGELTDLLLPIVALDDAVGLIIFAVSFGVARAMTDGNFDLISIVVEPLLEIILSLVLGWLLGLLLSFFEPFFESNSKRLCLGITFVMLTVAVSMISFDIGTVHIGFSTLLVCMMLGTVFCNVCKFSEEIMEKTDRWTVPLFALFFVLSGAELDLSVFADLAVVGIGVAYIISRSIGKYFGAYASAKAVKCSDKVVRNLGITLLPQAGVALGMSVTAESLAEGGDLIRNIVLFAVLVYELVGPLMTKNALMRAGEIVQKPENPRKREQKA